MEKPIKLMSQTDDAVYKDFFKLYYREKLRLPRIIMSIAALLLFAGALYAYYRMNNGTAALIGLWLGVFLIVYPRMAYKKPYKAAKGHMVTSRFTFEDDKMTEKSNKDMVTSRYADIKSIIETKKYFIFLYTGQSASVADKKQLSDGDAETLRGIFKAEGNYKFIKCK